MCDSVLLNVLIIAPSWILLALINWKCVRKIEDFNDNHDGYLEPLDWFGVIIAPLAFPIILVCFLVSFFLYLKNTITEFENIINKVYNHNDKFIYTVKPNYDDLKRRVEELEKRLPKKKGNKK